MIPELHPKARCCWCRSALMKMDGQWWCQTQACRDQQREHAVAVNTSWRYVPTPKQVEFDKCAASHVLFGGAAGPGKSHAARWALYRKCLTQPGYEALILRRTFPELEKTHLRRMATEAPLIGAEFIESKRLMRFPVVNGRQSLIECGHMDDDEAVSRYLSTEYDAIVPDEGVTFEPGPLLELSTRTVNRRASPNGQEHGHFWVVTNPGGPAGSMLLDFFIDHQPDWDQYAPILKEKYQPDDWVYIAADLEDNPYLDPNYEGSLAVLAPWRYEQLRHGDWRIFSGQFFHTFNERRHVQDLGTPEDARWFRSLDWGFNAPGCVGWYGILGDGHLYCRADYKFQGLTVGIVAEEIHKRTRQLGVKISYDVGDPAIWIKIGQNSGHYVGSSIGDTFSKYGLYIGKADNERYNGWMRCHEVLRDAPDGQPWFILHPDAKYGIRSIPQATSAKDNAEDVNTDSDDHWLDQWRYAMMSRPAPSAKVSTPTYGYGTMGWLKQQVRRPSTWLGGESARG